MESAIRKSDCELILSRNYIGHLAYIYQDRPFTVPITYYYNKEKIICYSGQGHKIKSMRLNGNVSLQVSEIDEITKWKSVMVHGKYKELEGSEAKSVLHDFSLGIKEIISVKELKDLDYISQFSARIVKDDYPIVFVVQVYEISGRMRV